MKGVARLLIGVRWRLAAGALAVWIAGAACTPGGGDVRVQLESHDPADRVRAILTVAQDERAEVIPALVDRLDDEDAAVRFCAIHALEDLTGLSLGYSYAAPRGERRVAVEAWRSYVASRAAAAARQADAESCGVEAAPSSEKEQVPHRSQR